MNDTHKPASNTTGTTAAGFTDEERAAMKEHGQELKTAARRGARARPRPARQGSPRS